MEDKSLHNIQQPQGISKNLQLFIDSMVEEIVLEGKPFDTQKKYLKKFSENEGVNYDKLEADIATFIELLDSFKTAFSKSQVKLAEEKGSECYISKEMQDKLIKYSSSAKEIADVDVDSIPNTKNEMGKRSSIEPWLWGISAFFMVFVYSQIIALTSSQSQWLNFYEGSMKVKPVTLLAGLVLLCWILKKKGNTLFIVWGIAAIWLLVYWLFYMSDDYTSMDMMSNGILNVIAIIVIVILAISFIKKKKSSEHEALVIATISSIMILNPMVKLYMQDIMFSQDIMSFASVLLIVPIIVIVAIITMVFKFRNKTSTLRIFYIISTALACYYIIAFLFSVYFQSYIYRNFDSFVIEGVLCTVIAIILILAWTKHNIREEVRTLLFLIISMLCMSNLLFGLSDFLRFREGWDDTASINLLCCYTPIFIFWTAYIYSYLKHLLHPQNSQK